MLLFSSKVIKFSSVTSVSGLVFNSLEKSIYDLVSNFPDSIFNKKSLLISDNDIFLGLVEFNLIALIFCDILVGVYVKKLLLLLLLLIFYYY